MAEINIAERLIKARHEKKITQEELARYAGVSKAAVSKWESGASFPDIMLLPRLAAYFNISIDELIGYEPQLTGEQIKEKYRYLKQLFAEKCWEEAIAECNELEKKYYSCFPFLLQLAVLLLNHASLSTDPGTVCRHAAELSERVKTMSEDVSEAKEAASFEALCYLYCGEPMKAMDLLDEKIRPSLKDTELLAQVYKMTGRTDQAQRTYQIAMYEHLIGLIADAAVYVRLYAGEPCRSDVIIERTMAVISAYETENLHPNSAAVFFLAAAEVYCLQNQENKAFDMIERYADLCIEFKTVWKLHGDDYFDRIDSWFQEFDLGDQMPRSESLIYKSMIDSVEKNPKFANIRDHSCFVHQLQKMKTALSSRMD